MACEARILKKLAHIRILVVEHSQDDLTPRALSRACAHALTRSRLEREIDTLRRDEISTARREREARIQAEFSLAEERKARERVTALHKLSSTLSAATTAPEILEDPDSKLLARLERSAKRMADFEVVQSSCESRSETRAR